MAIKITPANAMLTTFQSSAVYCYLLDPSDVVIDVAKTVSWGTPTSGSMNISASIVFTVLGGRQPSKVVLNTSITYNSANNVCDPVSIGTIPTYPTDGTFTLTSFIVSLA